MQNKFNNNILVVAFSLYRRPMWKIVIEFKKLMEFHVYSLMVSITGFCAKIWWWSPLSLCRYIVVFHKIPGYIYDVPTMWEKCLAKYRNDSGREGRPTLKILAIIYLEKIVINFYLNFFFLLVEDIYKTYSSFFLFFPNGRGYLPKRILLYSPPPPPKLWYLVIIQVM